MQDSLRFTKFWESNADFLSKKREKKKSYTNSSLIILFDLVLFLFFKIIARDQKGKGLEGRADLVITVKDINDNAPTFDEEYVINIEPWTTVGTKIETIKATDNDKTDQNNKIMYLLRTGGVGKFQLDFDTGKLIVYYLIWKWIQNKNYQSIKLIVVPWIYNLFQTCILILACCLVLDKLRFLSRNWFLVFVYGRDCEYSISKYKFIVCSEGLTFKRNLVPTITCFCFLFVCIFFFFFFCFCFFFFYIFRCMWHAILVLNQFQQKSLSKLAYTGISFIVSILLLVSINDCWFWKKRVENIFYMYVCLYMHVKSISMHIHIYMVEAWIADFNAVL